MSQLPPADVIPRETHTPWGFSAGLIVGSLLTLAALGIDTGIDTGTDTPPLAEAEALASPQGLWGWIVLNLGHSFWFFALVLVLYLMNLHQLNALLLRDPDSRRVGELDQLSDVWMHLFVGIGVIWTAVGMRSALQAALGESPGVGVVDSADDVLRKLVDGGILLALTTTIVGGVGGYLMRLFKTLLVGARLQELFERQSRDDVQALVAATQRIESQLIAANAGALASHPEVAQTALRGDPNYPGAGGHVPAT